MSKHYFAVDLGATSGRTILGSINGSEIEIEEITRFPNHLIQVGDHFHWDIYALYNNIIEGLKKVAARGVEIASIGIDTWGVDFALVGADGLLLRQPYAYRDPHTNGAPEAFFQRIPRSRVYELTGIQVMNFNSLYQLDTLRRNKCSALEAAQKVLFIPDALAYMLTGEMVTEYTIASTAQMVNAQTRKLEPELLAAVGLTEENFGRFVFPGEKVGTLLPSVQEQTGLGAIPVVAVAGHDTGSAVAAVPAKNNNFAYLSSGTWSLMGIETSEPVISEITKELNITNEGGVNGTIRLLKNICGMWLLERCRPEWPAELTYPELIAMAKEAKPFQSLINPDDACFANPKSMTEAINDYCAQTGQHVPANIGETVRCIFESLALRYRQVLDNLKELSANPIDVLHVIGGGSKNDLLNQFTASATGVSVVAGPSEATAIGNIMVQAVASGAVESVAAVRNSLSKSSELKQYEPQDSEAWKAGYERFKTVIR